MPREMVFNRPLCADIDGFRLRAAARCRADSVRMADTDQITVTFRGVGDHGSTPQRTIDPVVIAAQAILEIHARNIV